MVARPGNDPNGGAIGLVDGPTRRDELALGRPRHACIEMFYHRGRGWGGGRGGTRDGTGHGHVHADVSNMHCRHPVRVSPPATTPC